MENQKANRIKIFTRELLQMREEDQRLQKEGKWDEFSLVVQANTVRVKEIVGEIGWPTVSKVGDESSQAAWILVQHSDHDPMFQEQVLEMMKKVAEGEVKKQHIAYLEDRVKKGKGLPQIYGTQFWTDENGKYGPWPIKDPEGVDDRRAEVGLRLLAEYQDIMEKLNKGELKIGDPIKIKR